LKQIKSLKAFDNSDHLMKLESIELLKDT